MFLTIKDLQECGFVFALIWPSNFKRHGDR